MAKPIHEPVDSLLVPLPSASDRIRERLKTKRALTRAAIERAEQDAYERVMRSFSELEHTSVNQIATESTPAAAAAAAATAPVPKEPRKNRDYANWNDLSDNQRLVFEHMAKGYGPLEAAKLIDVSSSLIFRWINRVCDAVYGTVDPLQTKWVVVALWAKDQIEKSRGDV